MHVGENNLSCFEQKCQMNVMWGENAPFPHSGSSFVLMIQPGEFHGHSNLGSAPIVSQVVRLGQQLERDREKQLQQDCNNTNTTSHPSPHPQPVSAGGVRVHIHLTTAQIFHLITEKIPSTTGHNRMTIFQHLYQFVMDEGEITHDHTGLD